MVVFGAESSEVLRIAAAGYSSPSSAESSFRKIDDVFLQTQTRIWVGEVLQTRLNEQLSIADLLGDGELLFEVSRVIWKMMLTKCMELKCVKSYDYVPFTSRNSGRYMPYSNVDSFLKICKILGLAGIDLFSPSDVVEKRDTRKVCMCIRALSKKARSRHFNVPDFDIVTYTVAMPTDMVGYIRRSWELSHCGYSSSSHSPPQKLRQRSRQKHSNASSRSCDLYFEEFDDMELQSDSSATICSYDPCSQMSSDLTNSPEVSSEVKNDFFDQCSVRFDVKNQLGDECIHCQQEAVHLSKLTRSLFSHHLEHGHHQDNIPSPSFVDLNIQSGGRVFNAETGARNSDESIILDQIYSDPNLEDEASVVGDSCECSMSKSSIINDPRAISAIIGDENYTGDSVLHDGEDCISDASVGAGSCCSKANRTLEKEFSSRYLDGDISEVSSVASVSPVSSTASVSSVSVAFQNLDYDDYFDTEDAFKNVWFPESENSKLGGLSKKRTGGSKSQNTVEYETTGLILANNNEESLFEGEGMDIHFSSLKHFLTSSDKYTTGHLDNAISCDNSIRKSQINSDVDDEGKDLFAGQSCFPLGFPQWDQKGKNRIAVVPTGDDGCGASPSSLSLVESHGQDLQLIQTEVTGDALLHKKTESVIAANDEVQSITMVKSDLDARKQQNKCSPIAISDNVIHGKHEDSNASCDVVLLVETENVNKDEVKNENLQKLAVEDSDGTESPSIGIAKSKPHKRPILKSVVKGTAVVGALVLLLHFRKNGRDKSGWSRKQPNGTRNVNAGDGLSAKEQKEQKRHGANGVYPAEKLKL